MRKLGAPPPRTLPCERWLSLLWMTTIVVAVEEKTRSLENRREGENKFIDQCLLQRLSVVITSVLN